MALKQPTVIAFCGPKNHGKTTAGKVFTDLGGVEVNFADALKEGCSKLFGIPLNYFYDEELKQEPLTDFGYPDETPRTLLQKVGTDLLRGEWPDIFVNTWLNKARGYADLGAKFIVVTDWRFPNEGDALHNFHSVIKYRIVDPRKPINDSHESEAHALTLPVDHEIKNDGTLSQLREKVIRPLPKAMLVSEVTA